jgi:hypothetical protein
MVLETFSVMLPGAAFVLCDGVSDEDFGTMHQGDLANRLDLIRATWDSEGEVYQISDNGNPQPLVQQLIAHLDTGGAKIWITTAQPGQQGVKAEIEPDSFRYQCMRVAMLFVLDRIPLE